MKYLCEGHTLFVPQSLKHWNTMKHHCFTTVDTVRWPHLLGNSWYCICVDVGYSIWNHGETVCLLVILFSKSLYSKNSIRVWHNKALFGVAIWFLCGEARHRNMLPQYFCCWVVCFEHNLTTNICKCILLFGWIKLYFWKSSCFFYYFPLRYALRTVISSWYLCAKGDFQMPVHVQ